MDMLMKLFMGGWIPQGQRSQWMAFALAMGAVMVAVVQWGSGEMNMTQFWQVMADKWVVLGGAYWAYYMAEKADAKN